MSTEQEGLAQSLLSTPTYVLAIVFFIFLALSVLFEQGVEWLTHFFKKLGKHGLAEAVNRLVMELTLLGFVSLLLLAFSEPLGKMCVGYSPSMYDWTLVSNIEGCPCCLAHTDGLNICSNMQHECLYNVTNRMPYCDCAATGSSAYEAAGYKQYADAGLLDEQCMPYDVDVAQNYMATALSSVTTLADYWNISTDGICRAIKNGSWIEETEYEWEPEFRRRQLLAEEGVTTTAEAMAAAAETGAAAAAAQDQQAVVADQQAGMAAHEEVAPAGHAEPLNPAELIINQDPDAITGIHLMPRVKLFKCTGAFLSSSCPDGKVLLISADALEEVHIWLFTIAVFHVAVSVFQIALAMLRVYMWRGWERRAQAEAVAAMEAGSATAAAAAAAGGGDDAYIGRRFLVPGLLKHATAGGNRLSEEAKSTPMDGQVANGGAVANGHGGSVAPAGGSAAADVADLPSDVEQGSLPPPSTSPLGALNGSSSEPPAGAAAAAAGAGGEPQGGGMAAWARAAAAAAQRPFLRLYRQWLYQDGGADRPFHWMLLESAICLLQALSPRIVTRSNFLLMRASYLASLPPEMAAAAAMGRQLEPPLPLSVPLHPVQGDASKAGADGGSHAHPDAHSAYGEGKGSIDGGEGGKAHLKRGSGGALQAHKPVPDFVHHVLDCLQRDLPTFVGLSAEMGFIVVFLVLLSGVVGWTGPLFVGLAIVLLLGTNIALVAMLRYKCRGGRPNPTTSRRRKWLSPHLLLRISIRLILFLCSFVWSTTVFFIWQFGQQSCFFRPEADLWGIGDFTWVSGVLVAGVLLTWTSHATIPAYSLVVHTRHAVRLQAEYMAAATQALTQQEEQQQQQQSSLDGSSKGGGGSSQHSQVAAAAAAAEQQLMAEVAQLRERLAQAEAQLAARSSSMRRGV